MKLFDKKAFVNYLPIALWFPLVILFSKGYYFSADNQVSFFPVIDVLTGKKYLLEDFSTKAYWYYHINFNYFFAAFVSLFGFKTVFFCGYLAAFFLFAVSIGHLCESLRFEDVRKTILATLSAMLFWGSYGLDISNFWSVRTFEASLLAWPFLIFCVSYLLREEYLKALIAALVSGFIHFHMGIIGGIAIIFMVFQSPSALKKKWVPLSLLALIGYGALIWEHSPVFKSTAFLSNHFYIDYVNFRLPHHYDLITEKFLIFCFMIALFGIILWKFEKNIPDSSRIVYKKAFAISSFMFILCLLDYLDYYVLKWGVLAKMRFLRIAPITHLFFVIFAMTALMKLFESKDVRANLAAAWGYSFIFPLIFWGITLKHIVILGGATCLYSFYILIFKKKISTVAHLIVFPTLIVILIAPFVSLSSAGISVRVPAFLKHFSANYLNDPEWFEACSWIRTHLDKKATFITPPYKSGFTFYAKRKMIAEFKVNPFVPADVVEWLRRLQDLSQRPSLMKDCRGFACYEILKKDYLALSAENIQYLSKKYGASYLVTEDLKRLPFDLIYTNSNFKIYKII